MLPASRWREGRDASPPSGARAQSGGQHLPSAGRFHSACALWHFSIDNINFQSVRRRHCAEKTWFFRSFGSVVRLRGQQSMYLTSSCTCSKEKSPCAEYKTSICGDAREHSLFSGCFRGMGKQDPAREPAARLMRGDKAGRRVRERRRAGACLVLTLEVGI